MEIKKVAEYISMAHIWNVQIKKYKSGNRLVCAREESPGRVECDIRVYTSGTELTVYVRYKGRADTNIYDVDDLIERDGYTESWLAGVIEQKIIELGASYATDVLTGLYI